MEWRLIMSEKNINNSQINENDNASAEEYTVAEIIDELMKDPSWEADPMYRMRALGFIQRELFTAS